MMKIKYPHRAYITLNYPKIAYFAVMWLVALPVLPFVILSAISNPILNWYCRFGDWLNNKLNL